MSGRSPNGVASLRARFEQNKESHSPPSRGRSPAGSIASDTSRPISKVRISFVSVEGSGRMGDRPAGEDAGSNVIVSSDGPEASGMATDSNASHESQTDTASTLPPASSESQSNTTTETRPSPFGPPLTNTNPASMDGTTDVRPDQSASSFAEDTPGIPQADPKNDGAFSGGDTLAENAAELGSILKGSPFEQDGGKPTGTAKPTRPKGNGAPTKPSASQSKPSAKGLANGRPKEVQAPNSAAQAKTKSIPSVGRSEVKPAAEAASQSASTASKAKAKTTPLPGAIETHMEGHSPPPETTKMEGKKPQKGPVSRPRTPANETASGKQQSLSKASPRLGESKGPRHTAKDTNKSTSGPIVKSKPPAGTAAKEISKPISASAISNTKPAKKVNPTSPRAALSKSRPKSPTRPAKLPAAATAPTAASAAKLDGAPPSSNDRKPTTLSSTRDRTPSIPTKGQPKPTRTSLPAGSKPPQIPKVAKPRMSMASSKAPEGSFLERMMRPTQSSSQKTHEKAEPRTPPKKHLNKPKRNSEDSDKSKAEPGEARTELVEEPANSAVPMDAPSAASPKAPPVNGTMSSISAAAHTTPPSIPTS